eukprot:31273-Pelagococcus_subviridis.AAC.3
MKRSSRAHHAHHITADRTANPRASAAVVRNPPRPPARSRTLRVPPRIACYASPPRRRPRTRARSRRRRRRRRGRARRSATRSRNPARSRRRPRRRRRTPGVGAGAGAGASPPRETAATGLYSRAAPEGAGRRRRRCVAR